MTRQRGIAMLGILAIVIGAAAAGGITFHFFVVTGLKSEVKKKQDRIESLTEANTKLTVENTRLVTENLKAAAAIDTQNKAIQAYLIERENATKEFQQAKASAAKREAALKQQAAAARAFAAKAGEQWHDTWARQVKEYIGQRKAEALNEATR